VSIHVTRSLLPPLEAYVEKLESVWESGQLTNDGPLLRELERGLEERLGVPHGVAVANGTLGLQLACAGLEPGSEVLLSPLSFVASVTALQWRGLEPVFADIHPERLTLDPERCAEKVGPRTRAILATHVYGLPCDVDGLGALARQEGLELIFDASHAFGCRYRGRPLASYGDASVMSLHAAKILHCAEGGFIATSNSELARRSRIQRNFGFDGFDSFELVGINAKLSELHAAMGLCLLPLVDAAIRARKLRFERYLRLLGSLRHRVRLPTLPEGLDYNYAYLPVLLESEDDLIGAWRALVHAGVFARRYFHPALNTLPTLASGSTRARAAPIAESVCPRLLCLPLYDSLPLRDVDRIAETLGRALR